jgi:hypothetical protein
LKAITAAVIVAAAPIRATSTSVSITWVIPPDAVLVPSTIAKAITDTQSLIG